MTSTRSTGTHRWPRPVRALDPQTHPARDAIHFRRILAARRNATEAARELREAMREDREAGDSWAVIGTALDTTRQAAFQRFDKA